MLTNFDRFSEREPYDGVKRRGFDPEYEPADDFAQDAESKQQLLQIAKPPCKQPDKKP